MCRKTEFTDYFGFNSTKRAIYPIIIDDILLSAKKRAILFVIFVVI